MTNPIYTNLGSSIFQLYFQKYLSFPAKNNFSKIHAKITMNVTSTSKYNLTELQSN